MPQTVASFPVAPEAQRDRNFCQPVDFAPSTKLSWPRLEGAQLRAGLTYGGLMQAASFTVPNATYPNIEVVGESSYESQIRSQFGPLAKDQDKELFTEAVLVPEPDNPYDSNAISVRVKQAVVGYLSRDDARA